MGVPVLPGGPFYGWLVNRSAMSIGPNRIDHRQPAFVIAEAGVNHNGDPAIAHQLIDAAAGAGAAAVKFQTFKAERVVHSTAATAAYQAAAGEGDTQLEMLRRLELPGAVWHELLAHASELGLTFLSTAFDEESLELLNGMGVDALKIPSGELDSVAFLEAHVETGLPLIVSTGMATMAEVERAVEVLDAGTAGFCLLHCVTAYPAPVDSANIRAIATMADRFAVPIGWSDHTEAIETAIAARALGACVFERHLTLDRTMPGPDHLASDEPAQFSAYVRALRVTEAALGSGVKEPAAIELDTRRLVRRSYFATRDLAPGQLIGSDDVVLLRPVEGIPASEQIVGKTVAQMVPAGSAVREEDLR
jgi:N,N'-diacetyllegionaminate synthase